jgi:hypothetical protein
LDGRVVNNDNGVFVEKSRPGRPLRRKFLITFGLEKCNDNRLDFPILGIDLGANLGQKRQLGTKGAHCLFRINKQKELQMKSTRVLLALVVAVVFVSATTASPQKTASFPAGPVPPAILHAKSVFISNSGSSSLFFRQDWVHESPYLFNGDQTRFYSEFYAALEATGDYKLRNDPIRADMVLELELPSIPLPEFRLVVYGATTRYPLWTITQAVEPAELQQNRDKNFDRAVNSILNQFLQIAGKASVKAP